MQVHWLQGFTVRNNKETRLIQKMSHISVAGCEVCQKPCKSLCSGCKTVFYCCEEHQLYDWDRHSSQCAEGQLSHEDQLKYDRRKAVVKLLIEGKCEQAAKFARSAFRTACQELRLGKEGPSDDVLTEGLLVASALLQCDMVTPARETLLKLCAFFEAHPLSKSMSDLTSKPGSRVSSLLSVGLNKQLSILASLASLFEACGDIKQSEKLYVDYVSLVEGYFGVSSLETSDCYFQMGNYYLTKLLLEKAQACYRRALTLRSQQLGEGHLSVSDCFFNLGVVFYKKRYYNKALSWFEQAKAVRETQCSEQGLPTAHVYEKLGRVHLAMQNLEKAYEMTAKAWGIFKAVYKKENDDHARIRALLVKIDQAVEVLSPSKRQTLKRNASKAYSTNELRRGGDRSIENLKENISEIALKLRTSSLLKSRSSVEVVRKDSLSQSPIYRAKDAHDGSTSMLESVGSDWQSVRSFVTGEIAVDLEEAKQQESHQAMSQSHLEERKSDPNPFRLLQIPFGSGSFQGDPSEKGQSPLASPKSRLKIDIYDFSNHSSEAEISPTSPALHRQVSSQELVNDLQPDRRQGFALMSSLARQIGTEKFITALLKLDTGIPLDFLEQLKEWIPTESEMQIAAKRTTSPSDATAFLVKISEVPRYSQRLKALELKQRLDAEMKQIKNTLTTVRSAAEEITTSQSFLEFLKVVTKLGSAFNSGRSLQISTINRMFSLKVSGGNSFLTYLVSVLLKQRPQVLAFPEDFINLKEAKEISQAGVTEWIEEWRTDVETLSAEALVARAHTDNLFFQTVDPWVKHAKTQIEGLQQLSVSTTLTIDALKAYVGDEEDLLGQVLQLAEAVSAETRRVGNQ